MSCFVESVQSNLVLLLAGSTERQGSWAVPLLAQLQRVASSGEGKLQMELRDSD